MISVIIVKKKSINAYLIELNDYQSNLGISKSFLTSISNINCEKILLVRITKWFLRKKR